MPAILADGLTKHYRVKVREPGLGGAVRALFRPRYREVRAVEAVSFRIESGEVVGFLGPNGAGKTTTIKMLAGLLHPTSGRVEVVGFEPWRGGPAFKSRFALVLGNKQQLIWDLPPEETFLVNRAIYGIGWADYRRAVDELVGLLRLEDVLGRPVRQLSQGERMKCELAAALLHRPEVLFLDEPTLGLDVNAQETIRAFVRDYSQRHGATVLLTSHYMADVTALAERVLIINHGALLYDGALATLAERTLPVKRVTLVLAEPVPRAGLERYGGVREYEPPRAVLEVPRRDAARLSARLLAELPVLDLGISDPPVEEVIRAVFAAPPAGGAPVPAESAVRPAGAAPARAAAREGRPEPREAE
ncbi:MAG TPA: ATP-binding cassette domain-containing protein [Longimicrobiales bacterium]